MKLLIVSLICASRSTRSVTTMTESKASSPLCVTLVSWWASLANIIENYAQVVNGEVRHAPPEPEDELAGVTVSLVLLHGLVDGLFGNVVLELEGRHRQPVDEDREIEGQGSCAGAEVQLTGDREAVECEELAGPDVARRRRRVEEVDVVLAVLDALAEHGHDAVLGDLTLQTREERTPRDRVVVEVEGSDQVGLSDAQESGQLDQVERVSPVEVIRVALEPAAAVTNGASHLSNDERFEALLVEASDHPATPLDRCVVVPHPSALAGLGTHRQRPAPPPVRDESGRTPVSYTHL